MGLLADAKNIQNKDPAAKTLAEVLFLYPGFHALLFYRVSHWLYLRRRFFLARTVSQWGRGFTGIEIHPGAVIGPCLFIDHGMGIVIGETAEIGANCTIYHQVTLGGTGKETGKRHPTLGDNVLIGAGAKVLGPVYIGANARIAAGSVVLGCIPAGATAAGVPATVVRMNGERVRPSDDLDQQDVPNLLGDKLAELDSRVGRLEISQPGARPSFEGSAYDDLFHSPSEPPASPAGQPGPGIGHTPSVPGVPNAPGISEYPYTTGIPKGPQGPNAP
mgnify:CR=1 FL=1